MGNNICSCGSRHNPDLLTQIKKPILLTDQDFSKAPPSQLARDVALSLRQKTIENSLPFGTPFIKTYKYFVETLSSLRIGDLDSKIVQIQQIRFEKFYETAQDAPSMQSLLQFNDPTYKRDAVQLASQIKLEELRTF